MTLESEPRKAGDHPAIEDLERFMTGKLSPPGVRAVVRHLLGGCPTCSRETRGLWSRGDRVAREARTPRTGRQPVQLRVL
jgi:hypothetical protein